jgi:DNA repair protein RadC
LTVKELPLDDRPREKLAALGPRVLSNGELFALLFDTGYGGKSVVDIGRGLVNSFGGLNNIFHAEQSQLTQVPGIGKARAAKIQIIIELAHRYLKENATTKQSLSTPEIISELLRTSIPKTGREYFWLLLADNNNNLIETVTITEGTINQGTIEARKIVDEIVKHNAPRIALGHNHTSGIVKPSKQDLSTTITLVELCRQIGVVVIDHIIFTTKTPNYFSFRRNGLIKSRQDE